eukprot:3612646-Rhodomonas_salina.2
MIVAVLVLTFIAPAAGSSIAPVVNSTLFRIFNSTAIALQAFGISNVLSDTYFIDVKRACKAGWDPYNICIRKVS